MKILNSFLILAALLASFGCATGPTEEETKQIEAEMTPVPAPVEVAASSDETEVVADEEPITRYSELNNMAPPSDRQYKRMTRKKMEEESELYSSAGSLWKMEGQSSYLFAENKHRQEGDPTAIKMEGSALKMIETKVSVIKDLLVKLEEQRVKSELDQQEAEEEKIRLSQREEEKKIRQAQIERGDIVVDPAEEAEMQRLEDEAFAKAKTDKRNIASVADAKGKKEEKIDLKDVELIPSKIVEKINGDTYRIRGQQYLTISKKPYRVIATALVRAEDFKDEGISSTKLLEAQYDVVHLKKGAE